MRAALSSNFRSLLVAVALASTIPSLGLGGAMAAPLPTDIVAAAATDPGFKFEISSPLASLPSHTVDDLSGVGDKIVPSAVAAAVHPLNKREQVLDPPMELSEQYLVILKPDPGAADGVDTQNSNADEQENMRVNLDQNLGGVGHPQSRRQGDTDHQHPQARADATLLNLAQAPAPTGKKNRDVDQQLDGTSEKSRNKPIPHDLAESFDIESQDGVVPRTFDTGSSGIDIFPKKPQPVRRDGDDHRIDGSGSSPSGPGHRALEESAMDSRGISCGGILPPPIDDTAQLFLDPSGNSCGGIGHRSSGFDHHRRGQDDLHATDGNGSSPSGPGHRSVEEHQLRDTGTIPWREASAKGYHTNPSGSDPGGLGHPRSVDDYHTNPSGDSPGGPGHPRSFEEYRLSDSNSSSSRRGKSSVDFRPNPSGSDPGGPGHYPRRGAQSNEYRPNPSGSDHGGPGHYPRQLQDGPASGFNYDAHSRSEDRDGAVSLVDYEASTHRGGEELEDRFSVDLAWEKPNGGWWA